MIAFISNGTAGLQILDISSCICVADIAGGTGGMPDGTVDMVDVSTLLANWGTDGAGAAIAAPFDEVEVNDLLALLSAWGPCDG